jgi:hypothetical protein
VHRSVERWESYPPDRKRNIILQWHSKSEYISLKGVMETEKVVVFLHQSMRKPHFAAVYCAIPCAFEDGEKGS